MFKKKKKENKYNYITVFNKCKDCFYWTEDKEESITTEFDIIKMGICENDSASDFVWFKGNKDTTDIDMGDFVTYERFGCIHWSKEKLY